MRVQRQRLNFKWTVADTDLIAALALAGRTNVEIQREFARDRRFIEIEEIGRICRAQHVWVKKDTAA